MDYVMAFKRRLQVEGNAALPVVTTTTHTVPGSVPLRVRGNPNAPILVVCEPNSVAGFSKPDMPMDFNSLQRVAQAAGKYGLERDDFQFVSLCPPIADTDIDSASRKWKHVEAHSQGIEEYVRRADPKCIVTFGADASRVVLGSAVQITKARGQARAHSFGGKERVVVPMLAPGYVGRMPEHQPLFEADMLVLTKLRMNEWAVPRSAERNYEWREDISDILRDPPPLVSFDTETTGLRWWQDSTRILTAQFSWEHGQGIIVPMNRMYWPELNNRQMARLRGQVRELLENPRVRKVGHNTKYDNSMARKEGMKVAGWLHDTQLMAFAVDENMMNFAQDTCVRRWVPGMAGYSDAFEAKGYYDRMWEVPRDEMLEYGCGDSDACLQLAKVLDVALTSDQRQRNCYERMMMPGIMSFANNIEQFGILIDQEHLSNFGVELKLFLDTTYRELIQQVPAAVRLKHMDKGLKFSRPEFVKDILFSKEGFSLVPQVYTKSTKALPMDQREPSVSTKDHLPYFKDVPGVKGEFVTKLIDYIKISKLEGTYVGEQDKGTGFWQYIAPNGRIYPSYMLHRTVTGRTASNDPNGQNFPKRGRLAKAYLKIFKATPGFKIVSADLSQIELRIAAWMARDPAMLRIYRDNGDIHTATAKYVSGLNDEQWNALTPKERKTKRTQAKAVNFGFLYGMGWAKFMSYAKTDYDVVYTEREAKIARERFFTLYASLPDWHDTMRDFAREHGFVRALHGAVRHLPNIRSNDKMIRSSTERQAINSPVQRFGSDLGLMAVIRFAMQADPELFRVIGFVHDAVLVEARDGYEQECMSALVWAMENQPLDQWFGLTPPLPIKAEADIGINFGETLEMSELPPVAERPVWFNDMGFDSFVPGKPNWWDDNKEEEAMSQFHVVQRLSDVGL